MQSTFNIQDEYFESLREERKPAIKNGRKITLGNLDPFIA
jgi:sRNA-binding regulator protein Hfq